LTDSIRRTLIAVRNTALIALTTIRRNSESAVAIRADIALTTGNAIAYIADNANAS